MVHVAGKVEHSLVGVPLTQMRWKLAAEPAERTSATGRPSRFALWRTGARLSLATIDLETSAATRVDSLTMLLIDLRMLLRVTLSSSQMQPRPDSSMTPRKLRDAR